MKGRAPNCSKMGSQTEVRKKLKPNLWRERTEPCHNSKTRSTVMRTTDAANKKVNMRAISSPSRNRERNEREPATGPAQARARFSLGCAKAMKRSDQSRVELVCRLLLEKKNNIRQAANKGLA